MLIDMDEDNKTRLHQFFVLNQIITTLELKTENFDPQTRREHYLLNVIERIHAIASDGVRPEYINISKLICKIKHLHGSQFGSGKTICPKCQNVMLYSFGVLGGIIIRCKTPNCFNWSDISSSDNKGYIEHATTKRGLEKPRR